MTIMLVEALKRGLIKEGDYIKYSPDYQECILSEVETGVPIKQSLKTEDFMYQLAGIIYGQLILVADGATKQPVLLNSMTGHKNGPDAMQKYIQKCYSSKEFETKGVCLTESIFEKLPKELSQKDYNYCLATPCVENHYRVSFGVRRVRHSRVYSHELYYKYGGDLSTDGVRPAVILPSDIQIDQNNNLVKYEN